MLKALELKLDSVLKANNNLSENNRILSEENKKLTEDNKILRQELGYVRELLENLSIQQFSPKSEKTAAIMKIAAEQLLFNEIETIIGSEASLDSEEDLQKVKAHKRKKKRSRSEIISDDVPHEKILIPCEDTHCNICKTELQFVSENLVNSKIEYRPAQLKVLDYYREVKSCPHCKKEGRSDYVKKPEAPVPLIDQSLASPSILAEIMHKKFTLALPLYRQEPEWKILGFELSRQTMSNWLSKIYESWLKFLIDEFKKNLKEETFIHIDETPVQVLKEKGRANHKKSTMWVFATGQKSKHPIRLFHYDQSRSGDVAKEYLEGFEGSIQTDAYSGYQKLENLTHIGCHAHLRRYFKEALPRGSLENDGRAKKAIDMINEIFNLEENWLDKQDDELLAFRDSKERPLVDAFFSWIKDNISQVAPRSKLGKAFNYALNHEEKLRNYLDEPQTTLSNNIAENAIRPFVLGRKNWLFCGSPGGADTSAALYSIIETAKANKLLPREYLKYLLSNITKEGHNPSPELIKSLLPWQPEVKEICGQ